MSKKRQLQTPFKTDAEFAAFGCQASCRIGRDALTGKTQHQDPMQYAVFSLLHAVEDLSKQIAAIKSSKFQKKKHPESPIHLRVTSEQ